jgi:hypothetical protein
LPLRDVQLGEIDSFIPMVNAGMFVGELTIAILFFAQAAVFRSRALTIRASGYVCAGLLRLSLATPPMPIA